MILLGNINCYTALVLMQFERKITIVHIIKSAQTKVLEFLNVYIQERLYLVVTMFWGYS